MLKSIIRLKKFIGHHVIMAIYACFVIIVLMNGASAQPYNIGINCGSDTTVLAKDGTVYHPDVPYPGLQGFGYVDQGSSKAALGSGRIFGTVDNKLFLWSRVSQASFEYRFDLPTNTYIVTLHVADLQGHNNLLNRYKVQIEGIEVESALAPHFPNRRYFASRYSWLANVSDGALDVRFEPLQTYDPIELVQINAIAVQDAPVPYTPGLVDGFILQPTYNGIIALWNFDEDKTVAGYEIEHRLPGDIWKSVSGDLIHSYRFIDSLSPQVGGPVEYRIRAMNVWDLAGSWTGPISEFPVEKGKSDIDFYELNLDPLDQLTLDLCVQKDLPNEEYVPGDFFFDTFSYLDIKTRYRGTISLNAPKKSKKINFKSTQPFKWLDKLNLNAAYYDFTMQKERSSGILWSMMGQPASFVKPVNLMVNGEYQGVHQSIEQVDELWLDRMGLPRAGNLYKAYSKLIALSTLQEYLEKYEHKWGPAKDNADLIDFIENINFLLDDDLESYLAETLDIDNFSTWHALNVYISQWDATCHNYYLYHYPQSEGGRWIIIPWDMDLTWGYVPDTPDFTVPVVNLSLLFGMLGDDQTPPGWFNVLLTRFLLNPAFRWRFIETLEKVYNNIFKLIEIDYKISMVKIDYVDIPVNILKAYHMDIVNEAPLDPWKYEKETLVLFNKAPEYFREYALGRIAYIHQQIPQIMLPFEEDTTLNEILAVNHSIIQDEQGEFEPWIEIRNNTPIPRELTGWSMSDDQALLVKWVFPNITVEPYGYILIWADSETEEGLLHTNFQLSDGGGILILSRPGETVPVKMDELIYGSQIPDISMGRLPDGHGSWDYLDEPTPGKSNIPGLKPPPLFINEFLASNVSVNRDEFGEYDDWVEIYNAGTIPISLLGFYLTDDLNVPFQWACPDVTIPAGGFLLIWCDEDIVQGELHAGFKLSKSGEEIGLVAGSGLIVDAYAFGVQADDISEGRLPDGNTDWVFFQKPTPGAKNKK